MSTKGKAYYFVLRDYPIAIEASTELEAIQILIEAMKRMSDAIKAQGTTDGLFYAPLSTGPIDELAPKREATKEPVLKKSSLPAVNSDMFVAKTSTKKPCLN